MMRKHLKNYLVPHAENDHKPKMLHGASVAILALIAVVVFVASAFHAAYLIRNSDFLAAVLPGVLVDLANGDRAKNGELPLSVNPILEQAAQLKANDMAAKGYFAHESPEGLSPWHWFIEAGYQFTYAGENLAVNFVDSEDVEEAWLNSPGHRANILNGVFTEIGIATAQGEYKGGNTVFVVQLFGRPAPVAAVPAPIVAEASTNVPSEPEALPEAEPASAPTPTEDNLEVVVETPTFVAVEDTSFSDIQDAEPIGDEEATAPIAGTEATGLTAASQSTLWERLATEPRELLEWVYFLFAAILVLVLTATIVIEIEKQHPRHIFYGILLLALLLVLLYINRTFIFPGVIILAT
jgi:hypothetical protein